ncbi:MAG: hypothetical protein ABF513_10125, partial [Acetobacter malorum]
MSFGCASSARFQAFNWLTEKPNRLPLATAGKRAQPCFVEAKRKTTHLGQPKSPEPETGMKNYECHCRY